MTDVKEIKEAADAEAQAARAESVAAEAQSDAVTATAAAAQGAVAAAEAGAALAQANAAKAEINAAEEIQESEARWAHLGTQIETLHQKTAGLETGLASLSITLSETVNSLKTDLTALLTLPASGATPGVVNPATAGQSGAEGDPPSKESQNKPKEKQRPRRL